MDDPFKRVLVAYGLLNMREMMFPPLFKFRAIVAVISILPLLFPPETFAQTSASGGRVNGWGEPNINHNIPGPVVKGSSGYWGLKIIDLENCILQGGLLDYTNKEGPQDLEAVPKAAPKLDKKQQTLLDEAKKCEEVDYSSQLGLEPSSKKMEDKTSDSPANPNACREGNGVHQLFSLLQSEAPPEIKYQALALVGGGLLQIGLPNNKRYIDEVLIGWGIKGNSVWDSRKSSWDLSNVQLNPLPDCRDSVELCDQVLQTLLVLTRGAPERVAQEIDLQLALISKWPETKLRLAKRIMTHRAKGYRLFARFLASTTLGETAENDVEGNSRWGHTPAWRKEIDSEKRWKELQTEISDLTSEQGMVGFLSSYTDKDFMYLLPALTRKDLKGSPIEEAFIKAFASEVEEGLRQQVLLALAIERYASRLGSNDNRKWLENQVRLARSKPEEEGVIVGIMLMTFQEYEVRLPFRRDWVRSIGELKSLYDEKSIFRDRLDTSHHLGVILDQATEKQLCKDATIKGLRSSYDNEQSIASLNPDYESLFLNLNLLVNAQFIAGQRATEAQKNVSRGTETVAQDSSLYADRLWTDQKCMEVALQEYQNRRFSVNPQGTRNLPIFLAGVANEIGGDKLELPLNKLKISSLICGAYPFSVKDRLDKSFGLEVQGRKVLNQVILGSALTVIGLTIMVASLGVATPLTAGILIRTGLAVVAENGTLTMAGGSLLTAVQFHLFRAILTGTFCLVVTRALTALTGLGHVWDKRLGVWGNLIKPWIMTVTVFLILPFSTMGADVFIVKRFALTGLAAKSVESGAGILTFALLDYAHRAWDRLTAQKGHSVEIWRGWKDAGVVSLQSMIAYVFFQMFETFKMSGNVEGMKQLMLAKNQILQIPEQVPTP